MKHIITATDERKLCEYNLTEMEYPAFKANNYFLSKMVPFCIGYFKSKVTFNNTLLHIPEQFKGNLSCCSLANARKSYMEIS
ncbi:unnamed protein product [Adineta ricciae]|uniref:Uncharacterized protein n=1 Tax=Adineta ricciae TaxID=249248 RepID=A0A814QZA4_ADIRI|nr:unnamed protein product [Adineta ricciae]